MTTNKKPFSLDVILQSSREEMLGQKEASAQEADVDFDRILEDLTGDKTAQDQTRSVSKSDLARAIEQKVATLAMVTQSVSIKEAQLLGAAVYDGALARSAYVDYHATKVAETLAVEHPDLEKIAETIGFNEGMKIAAAIAEEELSAGIKMAQERLESIKEASYEQGHRDTLEWLATFA